MKRRSVAVEGGYGEVTSLRCDVGCPERCRRFGAEKCCECCPERVAELCRRFRLCRQGKCLCSDLDTLLMAAFADGDGAAFDALYHRNADWVRRLAAQIVGDWQEAQDIAQDAFLRVITARARWQATARFRTWMHRIVVNLSRKQRSRLKAVESLEALMEEGEENLPITGKSPEEVAHLEDAIQQLPSRQREAINWWLQGISIVEIAQRLGCSRQAVDALLHRARETLRRQIGGGQRPVRKRR